MAQNLEDMLSLENSILTIDTIEQKFSSSKHGLVRTWVFELALWLAIEKKLPDWPLVKNFVPFEGTIAAPEASGPEVEVSRVDGIRLACGSWRSVSPSAR